MKCPKCQHEIPDISKFCNICGIPLGETAHDDRFSLVTNYVPPELKERILEAGKQIESERRFVTVLFADVSGFTSLSEKLDPENVTMVMNDLFDGLISIISKYEGLIIDFFGDGILAVFGAPLAHENDPERAIRSALEMMPYIDQFNKVSPHKLPAPLGMHIGIHSGLVVVGNVGNDLRMRYSAVGDTVNLCSRIADHATRGEIYLSENTYKLLPSQLDTESAESIRVKGKDHPVTVYKTLSIKDEPVSDSVKGVKGFVGRREEKETILQALSQVLKQKEQILLICGEPGVGKSRLKDELVINATGKGFSVFEGKCSSFETKTPYFLWNTLLKDMLSISSEAPEVEIKKQLHDILATLNMDAEEPYLATLLSLRYEEILLEDDKDRKLRIFEAMHKLIDKFGRRQPTVFVLEDLHWADRFSKELLEFLMNKDDLAPSLFYIIFRPEYTNYKNIMNRGQLINLDRLSEEDVLELIKLRLNVDDVPDTLHELIKIRTEGNPFFIEESLKTLVENEFISIKKGKVKLNKENLESGVPDTVQGVVMARIDRLEGRIRDVLLNASVIGREFSRRLVERILNGKEDVVSHISHLKGLELILEREEAREFEYLFKHYMIQEVAYNTILINKRKKLHGMIAKAIEEIYVDRLKGLYELLAFHYEKAEEWEKAAEYYGRAGRKVREIYTEEESKDLFERKNYAIEKIYEAKPQKSLIAALFAIFSIALMLFVSLDVVKLIITTMNNENPSNWNIIDVLKFFNVGIVGGIFLIIWDLWFISLLISIYLTWLQRIRLFDLMSDRLEIVKKNNKKVAIPFSDIELIRFAKTVKPKTLITKILYITKTLYKEVDQNNTMEEYHEISDFQSLKKGMKLLKKASIPYEIGIADRWTRNIGITITILRKSGIGWLKVLFPWLHTLENSRCYVLQPTEPMEFSEQLSVAYEKWKRTNVRPLEAD